MANIAEGFDREGNTEFSHFVSIAMGSCGEVRSHLYTVLDAGYISQSQFEELMAHALLTSRLLHGLARHLKQSDRRGPKFDY